MNVLGPSNDGITRLVAIVAFTLGGIALVVLASGSGPRREPMFAVSLTSLTELSMVSLMPEWPRIRDATAVGGVRRIALFASQFVLLVVGLCLAVLYSAWFLLPAADAASNLFVMRRKRGARHLELTGVVTGVGPSALPCLPQSVGSRSQSYGPIPDNEMATHGSGRNKQLFIGTACLITALVMAMLSQGDYQRREFRLALALAFLAEALLFLIRWEQPLPWASPKRAGGLAALPNETRLLILSETGIAFIGFILAGNLSLWYLIPLIAAGCSLIYAVKRLRRI